LSITTISSKGQVTIPKEIREELELEPGDKVKFELGSGGTILKRVPRPSISMRGLGRRAKKRLGDIPIADLLDSMREEDLEEL